MALQHFALPPGVYYIKTIEDIGTPSCNVVNPGTDSQQLFVATPSTSPEQQWLISGNGIMRSLNVMSGQFAAANLSSSEVPQAVKHATSSAQWIINVKWDEGGKLYKGPIIASDSSMRRFALNSNNIKLAAAVSKQEWVFVAA